MKPIVAEEILVKLMNWDGERLASERPRLQAMANYKLDEYQQFAPGIRFIESLVKWISQFETTEEKEIAYNFATNTLVFLSNNQLFRLIDIVFSTYVRPILSKKTAEELDIKTFEQLKITQSIEYLRNQRSSIYIGLSDGARMDYFRRTNRINNEQILLTYAISDEKILDMCQELKNDYPATHFNTVFLVDDFTASGKSFIRKSGNKYKGKIIKTIDLLYKKVSSDSLVEEKKFELHILFYIATEAAMEYINNELNDWKLINKKEFNHTVSAIQVLSRSFNKSVLDNADLLQLCEKYFDNTIVNDHFEQGAHEKPYLGFNEGALPLVLNHNTPNNSLPIIWFPEDLKFRGLFPRVSRHSIS